MASGQAIIRELTEKFVQYLDQPKESRKQGKAQKNKEPWSNLWFGMVPTAMRMWREQKKK